MVLGHGHTNDTRHHRPAIAFPRLQWLLPIAVAIHNLEEMIWLPPWVASHAGELPYSVNAGRFRFTAIVLIIAAGIITYLSVRRGPGSLGSYLFFGYAAAMLGNVLAPHVLAALIFRSYVPGLVTAVLINAPSMTILAVRALRERYVWGWRATVSAAGVAMALVVTVLLQISR